jgi:cystathionine beta-synthase
MKKYDIDQVPVMNGNGIAGAVSESGLFGKLFSNPELRNEKISNVMEPAFPVVAFDTPLERLSTLITKENGAVMSKDDAGNYHIVTKYDLIQSLAK